MNSQEIHPLEITDKYGKFYGKQYAFFAAEQNCRMSWKHETQSVLGELIKVAFNSDVIYNKCMNIATIHQLNPT
jgi:hypothetical protein